MAIMTTTILIVPNPYVQILEDKETKPLVSDCYHIFATVPLMSLNKLKKNQAFEKSCLLCMCFHRKTELCFLSRVLQHLYNALQSFESPLETFRIC